MGVEDGLIRCIAGKTPSKRLVTIALTLYISPNHAKNLQKGTMALGAKSSRARGITLVELLAVVFTVAALAALLLPVLNKARIKAQHTTCLSNLRQSGIAWLMYSSDNNGRLVESYPLNNSNAWVLGDMRNAREAVSLELLRQGKLYPYHRNTGIYHCPADKGVEVDGKTLPSVRSYSMNAFMGFRDPAIGPIPPDASKFVLFYSKEHEIPKPSTIWVLLDEDERSINDGFFVPDPDAQMWIDFPAASAHRHNYSFALDFADGHSDVWRYRDPATRKLKHNKTPQAGNVDLERLARASATPK
jgi:hypothetical protein